jgi:hypothetical protein
MARTARMIFIRCYGMLWPLAYPLAEISVIYTMRSPALFIPYIASNNLIKMIIKGKTGMVIQREGQKYFSKKLDWVKKLCYLFSAVQSRTRNYQ